MLFNFTNHPWLQWPEEQKKVALSHWGGVQDVPFPSVDPLLDAAGLADLAQQWVDHLQTLVREQPTGCHAVHIMGEHTLCFAVVTLLKAGQVVCVASTTGRNTIELEPDEKISRFGFVRFRPY